MKKLSFEIKEKMVSLSGSCFWYWSSFYSFLDSSDVPRTLYLRFPKDSFSKYDVMRNILNYLEEKNEIDIIKSIISNFYRLKNAVDRDNLDTSKAKLLLREFRNSVGNDPIEDAIKEREYEKAKTDYNKAVENKKSKNTRLSELNVQFLSLASSPDITPQQRGFKFESLFFEVLFLEEYEHSKPYRTKDGEQIDGHFKYEKFDYLIEVKWENGPIKQKDLSIFDGKIRGKAQSTRGFFLSAEGFDENTIIKFSGDAPRIILMTGEDLAIVLNGTMSFYDVMKAKVDAIVRYGNIMLPVRNM